MNITARLRFLLVRFATLVSFFFTVPANAQYQRLSQSEALAEMERFASGKRVLYMAAHPDDENTRLIAWLSNALNAETTYLSLTRGSGGQNLLGPELGEDLGIIREHELLAARSVDGGNQEFTVAVDLGYSKDVREVWQQWSQDVVTYQVVEVIRRLQPDYIITRFPPDERAGHGHHTASAELAIACAQLAADPNYDTKDQGPWTVQGVWWNTSTWWDTGLNDDPEAVRLDLSGYDPLLGDTYGAIGDAARSMHKCQGFGVPLDRGPREEFFKPLSKDLGDFVSYLQLGEQGADSASVLAQDAYFALTMGDRDGAIKHWSTLGQLLREQGSTPARYQRWQRVFLHLTGIYAECYTKQNPLVDGEEATFQVEVQPMRAETAVEVRSIVFDSEAAPWAPRHPIQVKNETAFLHEVPTKQPLGTASVQLEVNGQTVLLDLPPVAKLVDRAVGEYRETVAWEPSMHLKFEQPVVWNYQKKTSVKFQVYSHSAVASQRIELSAWATIKEDIWTHRMDAALEVGWNEFEVELPSDLPAGKFWSPRGPIPKPDRRTKTEPHQ